MNVQPSSTSAQGYQNHEETHVEPGSFDTGSLDMEMRLAALLVESDADQAEAAQKERISARTARRAAAQRQIHQMRKAASDIAAGAFVNATFTVYGGMCQVDAAGMDAARDQTQKATLSAVGKMMSGCADPLGTIAGTAPSKYHDANAAEAKDRADDARAREEESRARENRIEQHTNRILEMIGELQSASRNAKNAVLNNG